MLINWQRKGISLVHPLGDHIRAVKDLELAIKIASMHATQAPAHLHEDLVSVAALALVEAKKQIEEQEVSDPVTLITNKVNVACTEFLRNEHPTLETTRTLQNSPSRGKRRYTPATRIGSLEGDNTFCHGDQNLFELWDLLMSLADNPFERSILVLLSQGYTQKEIAEKRGIGVKIINELCVTLKWRYVLKECELNA